jgi:hypothetical protein
VLNVTLRLLDAEMLVALHFCFTTEKETAALCAQIKTRTFSFLPQMAFHSTVIKPPTVPKFFAFLSTHYAAFESASIWRDMICISVS